MAEETSTAAPPTPTGASANQAVASGSSDTTPTGFAASPSSKDRALEFGGNPGGRPRLDGLKPGSPEALEADREKSRLKKQRQRARKRAENPPVLPSRANPPGASVVHSGMVQNQAQASPENAGVVGAAIPGVDWTAEDFRELINELIPAAEQYRTRKRTQKAAKAKLPADLLREIEKDSRWDEPTKRTLAVTLPRLGAKYANMSGIGAQWKDETFLAIALLRLAKRELSLDAKLDKIIAQNEAILKSKPETNPAVADDSVANAVGLR